jgi:hypothetical protein
MGKSAPVDGHSRCLAVDHTRNTDPPPRLGGTSKWSSLTWVLSKIPDECNSIITKSGIKEHCLKRLRQPGEVVSPHGEVDLPPI